MRSIRGVPVAGGVAIGPAVVVAGDPPPAGGRVAPGMEPAEVDRFAAAAAAAAEDYRQLAADIRDAGHPDEAEIFAAQAEMALDPTLGDRVVARIRAGDDAIAAARGASAELAAQLRALEDELLAARAVDLEAVADRIARRLAGLSPDAMPRIDRPSLVVAQDLAASAAASLPRDRLLGMALEAGSPTAHAAILARAWGVPAVVGAAGLLDAIAAAASPSGDRPVDVAIDGATGEVVVDPDEASRDRLSRRRSAALAAAGRDRDEARDPAVTADGVEVVLLANLGTPAEAAAARELGARGVGLFRTEFLFLERTTAPSEDEQAAAYRAVVEAVAPDPVTIRLLDVGGDKPIPYLPLPAEANPFLGVRALRIAGLAGDVLETQLRAAMRAAVAAPVKVMAPMVADAADVAILRDLAGRARGGLEAAGTAHGPIALGAMLEVPSAVVLADRLLPMLDFASLGTNDLLQYTLAADRGNAHLGRFHDPLHPALLRLVADAVTAAGRAGIELSVCGEMAGDPVAALVLVGLGIRRLSMAPSSLGPVRRAIRGSDAAVLAASARRLMDLGSAADVRAAIAAGASGVARD
jgi:phosphoenolpyruvate-protein phosphotransferase